MQSDQLLSMDKFRDYFIKNKPNKIKIEDTLQVKNYHLVIREFAECYESSKLPGQKYEEKHTYIKDYLESSKQFDHTKYFCPLYFITVVPDDELKEVVKGNIGSERIVYIGETKGAESRFKNGHLATQLLNMKEYDNYYKFIFMAQVFIEYEHTIEGITNNYVVPLEWFERELPLGWAKKGSESGFITQVIYFLEKYLIFNLRPELNTKDNPIMDWLSRAEIPQPNLLNTKELTPEKIYVNRMSYDFYPTNLLSNIELVKYIEGVDNFHIEQREEAIRVGLAVYTKSDYLDYLQEALSYNIISKETLLRLKEYIENCEYEHILEPSDIDSIL
ncbi:hypothetical protein [Priestia megaterium]|uniref:hypothetical protein n=1 Tax=Priestia megaterium TaxID=1404 RepID=UPI0021F4C9A7|nr:hypothetical protein [Priestia megaterium]UYP07263.1 hypothetical protein OIJ04_24510 [Priestia megaterium]